MGCGSDLRSILRTFEHDPKSRRVNDSFQQPDLDPNSRQKWLPAKAPPGYPLPVTHLTQMELCPIPRPPYPPAPKHHNVNPRAMVSRIMSQRGILYNALTRSNNACPHPTFNIAATASSALAACFHAAMSAPCISRHIGMSGG